MLNFRPEEFRNLLKELFGVAAEGARITEGQLIKEISNEMGYSVGEVRTWFEKRQSEPMLIDELNKLALILVKKAPQYIQANVIDQLFSANGMDRRYMSQDLLNELGIKNPLEDDKNLNAAKVAGDFFHPSQREQVLRDMEGEYKERIIQWSRKLHLASGGVGSLSKGFIHTHLERGPLPDEMWLELISRARRGKAIPREFNAQGLFQLSEIHVAITGEPGSGKTALCQFLAQGLVMGHISMLIELLPVPMSWNDIVQADSVKAMLSNTIVRLWPEIASSQTARFADYLERRLREGSAVALVDDYNEKFINTEKIEQWLTELLTWKRVVIFGRAAPRLQGFQDKFHTFVMALLNKKEIVLFVERWPAVTGRQINTELTINEVARLRRLRNPMQRLIRFPKYLDILCARGDVNDLGMLFRRKAGL